MRRTERALTVSADPRLRGHPRPAPLLALAGCGGGEGVRAFLDARARADWAKACAYLAAEQRKMLEQLIKRMSGNAACAKAMGGLADGVPASAFAHEAEVRDVLSLRVGGGHAFLIYTRPGGEVYATALGREGGAWKVISVGQTALD